MIVLHISDKGENMKENKRKIIVGGIILVALMVAFGVVYFMNRTVPQTGSKNIVVEVTKESGITEEYNPDPLATSSSIAILRYSASVDSLYSSVMPLSFVTSTTIFFEPDCGTVLFIK